MLVKASIQKLRISPIKANYVVRLIRCKKAYEALDILKFCNKRIAIDVRKCLLSAIANAEENYGLDIDTLKVDSAWVGKSLEAKRMMPRAKGRGNMIKKCFSNIYIILKGDR